MIERIPLWGWAVAALALIMLIGVFGDSPTNDVEPAATTTPPPSPSPSPSPPPTPTGRDHAQRACEQWLSAMVDTPDDIPWHELSLLVDRAGITAAQAGDDYLPLVNHLAALSIGLEIGSIEAFNKNTDAILAICDPLLAEYK